jgi:nucleoside-diphosphate-sugar epimerase
VTSRACGILPQGLPDHLTVQIDGTQCTATVLLSCAINPSSLGVRVLCEHGSAEASFDTQTILVRGQSPLPRRVALATSNFTDSWRLSITAISNILNYLRGKVVPYAGLRSLLPAFYASIRNSDLPPIRRELARAVSVAEETIFANAPQVATEGVCSRSAQTDFRHQQRVLVTGAGGRIGKAVVTVLVQNGYYVRALVRPTSSVEFLKQLGVEVFLGDVRRFEDVNVAAAGMDVVVHLAAGLHGSDEFVINTSVQGTQNISRAALLQRVKRVIYMSSMSVYDVAAMKNRETIAEDSPLEEQAESRGAYSLGKRRAEGIALQHLGDKSPTWTILRPSLVVGRGSDPAGAAGWMLGRNLVCLSSPRKRLLLIHVEDVATAVVQIIQHESTRAKIYTLSQPERITLREYVNACIRPQQDGIRALYVPYWLAMLGVAGAKAAKKLFGRGPRLNRRRLLSLYRNMNADCERLRQDTGWQPAPGLLRRLGAAAEGSVVEEQAAISQMTASD